MALSLNTGVFAVPEIASEYEQLQDEIAKLGTDGEYAALFPAPETVDSTRS